MRYLTDDRIGWSQAEMVLSPRQRLGIVMALTVGAWAVPSAIVYGLIQLL
jgi:hypothetical protein